MFKWLRYHPKWEAKYAYRDGKRLGPFLFSTKWTNLDDLAVILFGERAVSE